MQGREGQLIGRGKEQQQLRRLSQAGTRQLALVTGRRRVGKTWLLTHTWQPDDYFLFTASRTSSAFNRQQLLNDLGRFLGQELHGEDYPTWRSIFNLLLDIRRDRPLAVILDEFQYLADSDTGLAEVASELNSAWEKPRPDTPFTLVLAGSAVGTMQGLSTGGAPLYGRFNLQLKLEPFDYWHANEMAPFDALRDRARLYGVLGGMPRYLAAIDPTESLEQNITRLMLAPQGEIRLLLETALEQEDGLRDVAGYNAVLRAVATGATLQNEIAGRAGLKNDSALRAKLDRLTQLGYVSSHRNIGAAPNAPYRYRLNDPALRFHQRFVQPNTSILEREPPQDVWNALRHQLPAYMGLEFEQIARQAYGRLRRARNLPMLQEWGNYEGQDRNSRSLEIDVVAPVLGGGMLTGAIKWTREPMNPSVHYLHVDMLRRAADAGQRWAHEALKSASPLLYVSAAGFTDDFGSSAAQSGQPITMLSLADLYSEDASD